MCAPTNGGHLGMFTDATKGWRQNVHPHPVSVALGPGGPQYAPFMDVSAHDRWMACVHRQAVTILACSPMRPKAGAKMSTLIRFWWHPIGGPQYAPFMDVSAHNRWMGCVHRQAVAIFICSPVQVDGEHPKAPNSSARHLESTE